MGKSYAENHPEIQMAFMQTIAIANLEPVLLNKLESIEHTIIEYRKSAIYKIYPQTYFGQITYKNN